MKSTPTSTRLNATSHGERTSSSKKFWNKTPTTPAGMQATRIKYAMRWSWFARLGSLREPTKAAAMRKRSRQKNETTARTVPVWIDASNVSPKRS
jgi:hypothetical protein